MKKIENIIYYLVGGICFGLVTIAAFRIGLDAQKTLLGLPTLEKRVIALEIEADKRAGLYQDQDQDQDQDQACRKEAL